MTSRERVLRAINHEQPDRMPIDFGGMRSTGIMAVAYNKLKQHLGITSGRTRVFDTMQQLAEVELPILERFHIDVVYVENSFGRHEDWWKPWTLPDGSPAYVPKSFDPESDGDGGYVTRDAQGHVTMRAPRGCLYFEPVYRELAHVASIAEIEEWELTPISEEYLDTIHERAGWIYENTDYAILGGFGGNVLETGQLFLRGWDQFMMDMAADPDFTHFLLDKVVEGHLRNLKRYLEALGDYIQIIQMGDDLGTQSAPQLSLGMYREFIKPRHRLIYQWVHDHYPNVHVFLHSCGSVYDLIPEFIEEGVEILNPVQTSAAKMDPRRLKKEFGDRMTFWGGGCDTQTVLPNASPEEIEEHVRERVAILKPGGGYVLNQVHNVQSNVPPENVTAMLDAAYGCAGY